MKKFVLLVLAVFCGPCASEASAASESPCKSPIGDVELYAHLAQNPYFAHGVPPPGKQMKVERELCGFRIYVGAGSPESFGGDLLLVDADGRVTQIVSPP